MNVFQAISNLRVVRKYQEKEIDEKIVGLLLHMATYPLSAGNLQPWEFVVVDDQETKNKIAKAALKLDHVAKAPLCIVVGADLQKAALKYGTRGELVYAVEDAIQAAQIILITANAFGLGGDLIRAFDEEELKGVVGFPDSVRPVAIITLGYPAEEGEMPKRVPFEHLTHVNRFGNKIVGEFRPLIAVLESALAELRQRIQVKVRPIRPRTKIIKKLFAL